MARSSDDVSWQDIDGADQRLYTVSSDDSLNTLRVKISYTDDYGTQEMVVSSSTSRVDPSNYAPTGVPEITGELIEGSVLQVNTDLIDDPDGLGSFTYQWQKQDNDVWLDIDDAAENNWWFIPEDDEVGHSLRAFVEYEDGRGNKEKIYSLATDVIENVNDNPDGFIQINGSHIEDAQLTVLYNLSDDDGMGDLFPMAESFDQTVWNDIDGKTSSSYMPGDSDVGSYLRVLAGYTDGHGTDETITSDATSLIRNVNDAPESSVLVSGSPVEDEVLLKTRCFQWQSQDASWTDIIGASSILDEEVDVQWVVQEVTLLLPKPLEYK